MTITVTPKTFYAALNSNAIIGFDAAMYGVTIERIREHMRRARYPGISSSDAEYHRSRARFCAQDARAFAERIVREHWLTA